MKRSAGILLAISSLPSKYGIGCFSESAYRFVDWLAEAGQSYWQILPLGMTSYGDSPYQSFSTFAGNPYFISLEEFIKEGLLTEEDCENADFGSDKTKVDYAKLYKNRYKLLKVAYRNFRKKPQDDRNEGIGEECRNKSLWEKKSNESAWEENRDNMEKLEKFSRANKWLDDYALFMALKNHFGGAAWSRWESDIRQGSEEAKEKYRRELEEEISFYKFLQYHFFRQWRALKKYAHKKGIKIIGDIPIYVAFDSADVWGQPELFALDENYVPKAVAGVPPDGFSADGQLWGNPLYDWDYHRKTGYEWWISRLAHCFELYDVVRIDHFRGFDEYYSVPYGEGTAKNGHWEKGPGIELFQAMEKALGKKEVIAEDLGFMTDSVRRLVKESEFPNMKVLEFAFDSRDTGSSNDYLPHNYNKNCVAYTGTHDNQTLVSWYATIQPREQKLVRDYLCDYYTPDGQLYRPLISLLMGSRARLCMIPMQDYLGLDDKSRMNTPSTVGENWKWRMKEEDMNRRLCEQIRNMTNRYGRMRTE